MELHVQPLGLTPSSAVDNLHPPGARSLQDQDSALPFGTRWADWAGWQQTCGVVIHTVDLTVSSSLQQ
eukprot:1857565-Rhodomonas_salina.1